MASPLAREPGAEGDARLGIAKGVARSRCSSAAASAAERPAAAAAREPQARGRLARDGRET